MHHRLQIPTLAEVGSESSLSSTWTFQFGMSQSASSSVQETMTQTIQVSVPPFSNLTVDMTLASQV